MKNVKLALTVVAATLMCGSFAAQANPTHGNGLDNVQNTKSYQSFAQGQNDSGSFQGDNSVFMNHDTNR